MYSQFYVKFRIACSLTSHYHNEFNHNNITAVLNIFAITVSPILIALGSSTHLRKEIHYKCDRNATCIVVLQS